MGFIFAAFLNFTVGAILGGTMAADPALSYRLAPIHAILNPYGWLTLLIYGMTFAVLALSLGVQLPVSSQGWAQLVVAEAGVVLLVIGNLIQSTWPSRTGVVLLVLAPMLFLYNILSGVRYTKRLSRSQESGIKDVLTQLPTSAEAAIQLFGRVPAYRKTDAVGQRGTDVSLMLFIIATVWTAIWNWNDPKGSGLIYSQGLEWLTFYGWIGGTTLSVALHLAPRFLRRPADPAGWWSVLQVGWFGGVLLSVVGSWIGVPWERAGSIVTGIALAGSALGFLWLAVVRRSHSRTGEEASVAASSTVLNSNTSTRGLHGPGIAAWIIGWLFALVLGYELVTYGDPFALSSIHLLFLGFITSLVYAVGYTAFPIILGRRPPHTSLAYVQLICSEIGAMLLIGSFMRIEAGHATSLMLMSGGVLATVGVLMFLALWGLRQPSSRVK